MTLTNRFNTAIKKYGHLVALWTLILASFYFRTKPVFKDVFSADGTVKFIDTDSYFYLRQTMACVKNFPDLQKFDFSTHYPTGHGADMASFFPWVMALGLKIAGIQNKDTANVYLAWLMPLFFIFILWLLYLWGKLYQQIWVGILAGLILVLLPGFSLTRTILGSLDHHILEMILGLACAYQFDVLLVRGKALNWRKNWWRGWPLAAFFLCWPGAPLFLLILGLALIGWTIYQLSQKKPDVHQAKILGSYFGGALFILLLIIIIYPAWITGIDDFTLYLCMVTMAGGAFLPWLMLNHITRVPYAFRRTALPVGLLGIIAAASVWFVTSTAVGQEMWMRLQYQGEGISENAILSTTEVMNILGYEFYGVLAAGLALLYLTITRKSAQPWWFPLYYATALTLFWLNTFDLDYQVNIYFSWLMAAAVGQTTWFLQGKDQGKKRASPVSGFKSIKVYLPIILLVLVIGFSLGRVTTLGSFQVSSNLFKRTIMLQPPLEEALNWLKRNTPAEPIPVDSVISFEGKDFQYPPGAYGIVTAWDYGNSIIYEANRYAIWSRYPSRFIAKWLFAQDEKTALKILNDRCTPPETFRYIMLNAPMVSSMAYTLAKEANVEVALNSQSFQDAQGQTYTASILGPAYQQAVGVQLYRHNGPGYQHHRLVYESSDWSLVYHQDIDGTINLNCREAEKVRQPNAHEIKIINENAYYDYHAYPTIKIFEIVKGATITGQAAPGQSVQLTLPLVSVLAQRTFQYKQTQITDREGHFSFTVPYATELNSLHDVRASAAYNLQIFRDHSTVDNLSVTVSEKAVQEGLTIKVN